ncbi:MAG TPA: hypothetical protein VJS18_21135 [Paraburkholderia sp.]|nr:hypothetical protein [Paraburkholderia sp.]
MHPQTVAFILLLAVLAVILELFFLGLMLRRMRADMTRLLLRPWCRAVVPPYVEPLEPVREPPDGGTLS